MDETAIMGRTILLRAQNVAQWDVSQSHQQQGSTISDNLDPHPARLYILVGCDIIFYL